MSIIDDENSSLVQKFSLNDCRTLTKGKVQGEGPFSVKWLRGMCQSRGLSVYKAAEINREQPCREIGRHGVNHSSR